MAEGAALFIPSKTSNSASEALGSQENAESYKSDVPLPGGGPGGDSTFLTWVLDPAASPISQPFV